MTGKRILQASLVLIASAVILVAAAAIFVKVYFPPEKIQALIVAEAEKALKRKVEVTTVSLGIWSGLRVEGVRVSERPDFSKGEFVKADAFTFRFSWLPLLRRQFVAHELTLSGLTATLRVKKDGTTNIADITGAAKPAPKKPAKDEPTVGAAPSPVGALALQVDAIRLQDATLRHIDERTKTETTLTIPKAGVRGFTLDGSFPFDLALALETVQGKQKQKATFEAEGKADLAGLEMAGVKVDVETFAFKTGDFSVSGKLKLQDLTGPRLDGEIAVTPVDSKTLAAMTGAEVPPGLKIPALRFAFSALSKGKSLSVPSFTLSLAGMTVNGKLDVPDADADVLKVSMEAASNSFELGPLADIHPATRDKGIAGKSSFRANASGPTSNIAVPNAELHVELAPLRAEAFGYALPASKLDVRVAKSGDVIDVKKAELSAGEIKGRATGRVSNYKAAAPSLKLDIETDSVPFSAFASFVPQITNLRGKAKLEATVGGTTLKPKVAGTLDLQDAGFEYLKQKLEKFTGLVKFSESTVDIPKLTGKVNGGDLTLKFSLVDPAAPNVNVQGSLSVLDAGALEALMSQAPGDAQTAPAQGGAQEKAPPYTGPVMRTIGEFKIGKITHPNFNSGQATLDWSLTGVTPELKLMDGKANIKIVSGNAVKLLTTAKQKGGLAKALAQPLIILDKARGKIPGVDIPPLENIPFDQIVGDYTFRKGVLDMQPSLLEGPTIRAESRGKVDLVQSRQDLRVEIKAQNIANLALLVTGTMDDPDIKPDLTKVKEKAKEEAIKAAEKAAKDIFNKFLKK